MSEIHFSESYSQARHRFRDIAASVGAIINTYQIDVEGQDELAIDVATLGPDNAPTLVTSSGVHGVEGFLGSAVQHAFLHRLSQASSAPNLRHVFIHGVNPFGFSHLRRFNEDNVDLNRNFLTDEGDYEGAPEGYVKLNGLLNPPSPPSAFELFKLKALWNILRYGLHPIKESVAVGQYEYPRGIFFGGSGRCKSTRIIHAHCDSWIGHSERIVHIDFHSGLGRFGTYKLLLVKGPDSEDVSWYNDTFGAELVEPVDTADGTAYKVSGVFGEWMRNHFRSRDYRFVVAEFGTYNVIRVLGALRAENRAHHYDCETNARYQLAKAELLECFCPSKVSWRKQVIESSLDIMDQASQALGRGQ